uniref:Uncharacterized protein n=1 Tax=Tanacetum cinerariifolium TaxID=118510 RepID=A0A6L2JU02_TANCI|nr:hypothetical protein [Tanacetum cinerariifolium]
METDLLIMESLDILLMGDEDSSTNPARETDEFIKSSSNDLVQIPRESKVTSGNNLECDMLVNTPLPTTDVKKENFDINSPLGEYVSGGKTRVMETSSFGFHHMPSPRHAAYSNKEVMYRYYHPHLTSGDGFDPEIKKIPSDESKVHIKLLLVLWGNTLSIFDGSLPLSRFDPFDSAFKKVEEIPEVEIRIMFPVGSLPMY